MNWRHLNNAVHRDVGYFCAALTVVYAVSGIAVNHTHEWNPSYRVEREERTFEPVPVGERDAMVAALVSRLGLPAPKSSFRPAPHLVDLFYDGWSVKADAAAGKALVERPRARFLLKDANGLHLNHPKGIWTWLADAYAVALAFLAISGLFILKGRTGLGGRGKWFALAGLVLPLAFVLYLRLSGAAPAAGSRGRGGEMGAGPGAAGSRQGS